MTDLDEVNRLRKAEAVEIEIRLKQGRKVLRKNTIDKWESVEGGEKAYNYLIAKLGH